MAADADLPGTLLVAAAGLHAGFQLVVTALVYPELAATAPEAWRGAHDRHTRRITPVVVLVYGCLVLACGTVLVSGPTTAEVAAVLVSAVAVTTTAVVAAPAHGRLGRTYDPAVLRRLVRADRVRCVAAVGALLAAVA